MQRQKIKQILFLAVAAVFLVFPLRAEPMAPAAVIEKLHEKLISVMRAADALGYAGRREELAPVLLASFDLRRMSQVTVGSNWKAMTDAQRDALVEAFTDMTISNYASRFKGFSGEFFETLGTLETPHKDIVVQTHIVTSDEKIRIDYLLRETPDGWRIIDIFLKGTISELAARRSEYMTVIRDQGVDVLIGAVRKKAASLAAAS